MHSLRNAAILTLVIAVVGPAQASAFAEGPISAIRRTNTTLNKLLRKETAKPASKRIQKRLKATVGAFLDFEELARRALGKHWEKRTASERAEFVSVLANLIENNYVKQMRGNLDYKLKYNGERVKGSQARVETSVIVEKDGRVQEVEISYKMRKTRRGWMVYDVITDDVSVVRNYRSQFNRIIRRNSYEHLLKKMRSKAEKI